MNQFVQFLREERGSAAIEFVLVFPMVFTIFTASVESSVYMVRYVMFDRSIDKVVRQLRLGALGPMTHQLLKQEICENGMLIESKASCLNRMRIWMQPVNTGDFSMGSTTAACVDNASDINAGEPAGTDFALGVDNDIMLVRVCTKEWPMFPTTAVSIKMPSQSDGSVAMIVSTTFVNEPG